MLISSNKIFFIFYGKLRKVNFGGTHDIQRRGDKSIHNFDREISRKYTTRNMQAENARTGSTGAHSSELLDSVKGRNFLHLPNVIYLRNKICPMELLGILPWNVTEVLSSM
jgi:hypothetical protein